MQNTPDTARRLAQERRIAREQRQAAHEKRAGWIAAEDVLKDANNPNDLIRALKAGAVDCLFVHPTRWWLKPWTVPHDIWESAQFKDGRLWRNGVCLESPHQQLVVNERQWRQHLGGPSLEAMPPAPSPAPVAPATEQKSNAGAPAHHDWDEAVQHLRNLWKERGDPRDPLSAQEGWRSDIDAARNVADHLGKLDPEQEPPDPKTVADKLRPEIHRLRGR